MKTSSKLRRLQRARKLRRQRSAFFMILMVVVVMMAHAAFSKQENSNGGSYGVVSVKVQPGDTLWSIAEEYKADNSDLRQFVYEIAANNGLKDCNIVSGQTIFVPVV